jgi:hypothetical protein
MTRCIAFILALVFASLSVSSACLAADPRSVPFTLTAERGGQINARFGNNDRGNGPNWSDAIAPSKLIGLDIAGFYSAGSRPLRFALVREAGRLDCAGSGGNSRASGDCAFTADPAFTQLLASQGIGRPTGEEAFGLMALDTRRALIDALAAARYPKPTVDQLMALSALDVSAGFIHGLARIGYRPASIDALIEFKALNVTPEYIGDFARAGYSGISAEELVELKALNITPDFIARLERAGYGNLPVSKLVELKALDISADDLRAAQRDIDAAVGVAK